MHVDVDANSKIPFGVQSWLYDCAFEDIAVSKRINHLSRWKVLVCEEIIS